MIRVLVALLACLVALTTASARFGGGSPVTQSMYALNEWYSTPGYQDTTGRTTESAALVGGENTGIYIVLGQSLVANNGVSLYNPGVAKVQQLNPYDGIVYRIQDPILGASGTAGSMVSRLAGELVSGGVHQRVIMIPVAIGGTSVAQWAPGAATLNHRIRVAILRARQQGYPVTAIIWEQGQGDLGTSAPSYTASFYQVMDTAIGMGVTSPWFVAKDTFSAGAVDATIQGAQTALWGTTYRGVNIYQGADADSLTGAANRQSGGSDAHLTDVGNAALAVLWRVRIDAVF
jgi:hypothetical protein